MKNSKPDDSVSAAVYARFSSDNQRDESIDAQIRAIEEYAAAHGIHIVERYIDRAYSARSDKRPEFQRMIKESANGGFRMVIVHKLDRFSRDRYDSAYYKHILKNNGVRLQSVIENLDSSPEAIILESVIEGMAEYYSANLGRETIKGLKENAHNGIHTGGRPPLGYKIDPVTKRAEINEEEAKAVKLIFNMVDSGEKYPAVASALNQRGYKTRLGRPFSSASIHEILKNPKYVGICIYNKRVAQSVANSSRKFKDESEWIIKNDVYPPIVSRQVFDNVQKLLAERKVSGQAHPKEIYLLSGKIRCGVCGSAYCGERKVNSKGVRSYSYFCNSRNKHLENKCKNPSINRAVIEQFVLQKLAETVFDNSIISRLVSGYNKYLSEQNGSAAHELSELKRELNGVNEKIEATIGLLIEMKSVALKNKLSELEYRKESIEKQMSELSARCTSIHITEDELTSIFERIRQSLTQGELFTVKQLIDIYVNSVTVYPDKVVVVFNFFPSIGADARDNTQGDKNTECAKSAHSCFLPKYDLWDLLTYRLNRFDIYDFEIGNRLYRRLRTDRPRPPPNKITSRVYSARDYFLIRKIFQSENSHCTLRECFS